LPVDGPLQLRVLAPILIVALAGFGCARAGTHVRQVTYGSSPGSLRYVTRSEIRTTMQQLAVEVYSLDEMMLDVAEGGAPDNERILETLRAMRRLTTELAGGGTTNHPNLDRYLPALRDDIDRAIGGAAASPPSYYFAGSVSGACEYCHLPPKTEPDGSAAR